MPEPNAAPQVTVGAGPNVLARILAEEATLDRQVKEALFLTFNVDLGFFESRLLGPCRASGAAVTVIADSSMFRPDVRAVRAAGASYVVGLAAMPGAFHPKLTVLVGDQRALVCIGSGNVTMQGWHQNDELCTIITADRDNGCPTIVRDVAEWLRDLTSTVTLSPLAVAATERTANALLRLVDSSPAVQTGHVLVSSLTTPIIDQLPSRPASHLNLYAPFHDERGSALTALINRLKPSTIAVALQPGLTVISPSALDAVAKRHSVDLTFEDTTGPNSTYRHGKLLEAVETDGRRWALTGSANLSAAALLLIPATNGNCELGVFTTITHSLYPPTEGLLMAAELQDVTLTASQAPPGTPATSAVATLLQATIHDGVLTIVLSVAASVELTVQASRFEDPPEKYVTVGTVAVGLSSADFEIKLPPTSRIRLRANDTNGAVWGADFPLTDAANSTNRVQASGVHNPYARFDPVDLFHDPRLAERWHTAFNRVLQAQPAARLPRATVGSAGGSDIGATVSSADGWLTLDSRDAWARYSEEAENRLGTSMYEFAMGGLPQLGGGPSSASSSRTPQWVDRLDGADDEFDDDGVAEDVAAELELTESIAIEARRDRRRTEIEKRRYRTWLTKLTESMSELSAIDRSARAGLVLIGTQIDMWGDEQGSAGWLETLGVALSTLSIQPIPAILKPQMGAVATVGLYRMSEGLTSTSPNNHEAMYTDLRQNLRGLLTAAWP